MQALGSFHNSSLLLVKYTGKVLTSSVGTISKGFCFSSRFFPRGEGEGEFSGFQVTGMIAWGQKSKPQKIPAASNNQNPKKPLDQNLTPKNPMPNFRGLKNSRGTTQPGYLGTITESSYCFEYPKESLLKSSHPKNTCQNFVPKEIPKSKISNPKNPSIIPVA